MKSVLKCATEPVNAKFCTTLPQSSQWCCLYVYHHCITLTLNTKPGTGMQWAWYTIRLEYSVTEYNGPGTQLDWDVVVVNHFI